MLNANLLMNELDVASLVPDVYAEYRPMVAQALAFFLKHLSPARLSAILMDQASLPTDADLSTRVVRFMHACPALHKLGQVIARHRELDGDFRRRLQRLETMEPRAYMDRVAPVVRRDLGRAIKPRRITVGEPIAEASVAVVLPITWARDRRSPLQEGVVKVLKPGVVDELNEDLRILSMLADDLDRNRRRTHMPDVEYRDTFDEVQQLLIHEIDFQRERANLALAARQYAHRPDVQVPHLLPFASRNVTAMQRVRGVKVTDLCTAGATSACRTRRRQLAQSIVESLLGEVIFSKDDETLFHGDPHAGNLFAADDGRLAILDWSLAGKLRREDRTLIAQVLVGALALDPARIQRSVADLAPSPPDPTLLRRFVDDALTEIRQGHFPAIHWLMRLLDRLAKAGVRFPTDLLLFRKAYFTLEGVVQDVCPECSLEAILTRLAVTQLASEIPARLVRPPGSRDFPTPLSNADLLPIASLAPLNLASIWSDSCLSWLRAVRSVQSGPRPSA